MTLTVEALLIGVIDALARRVGATATTPSSRARAISYYVVLALVVIGSLIVVWAVVRNADVPWLAWILADLVFTVTLGGAWVESGRNPST